MVSILKIPLFLALLKFYIITANYYEIAVNYCTQNMTSYCITCTSDNIEKIIPRLYINNTYIDQNDFQKQYNGTINVYPNNSFLGEMPTYPTPLNISCGDETTFSKPVTVMGIKDPPHFNCTLSIAGSVVSWSQCVNSRDYINYYIVSISDAQSKINTTSNIMKTYIDFRSYPCGTTYQISVQPVNIVGEGVAAMVNYTCICPSSSGVFTYSTISPSYSPVVDSNSTNNVSSMSDHLLPDTLLVLIIVAAAAHFMKV